MLLCRRVGLRPYLSYEVSLWLDLSCARCTSISSPSKAQDPESSCSSQAVTLPTLIAVPGAFVQATISTETRQRTNSNFHGLRRAFAGDNFVGLICTDANAMADQELVGIDAGESGAGLLKKRLR